jgi:hypothetical protein
VSTGWVSSAAGVFACKVTRPGVGGATLGAVEARWSPPAAAIAKVSSLLCC